MPVPSGTGRLFPHHEERDVDAPPALPFRIARLLEDGASAELRELFANGEAAAGDWLERHGARQLSRRSFAFWEMVLDRRAADDPEAQTVRTALWPL